jgi:hypothetical protein
LKPGIHNVREEKEKRREEKKVGNVVKSTTFNGGAIHFCTISVSKGSQAVLPLSL